MADATSHTILKLPSDQNSSGRTLGEEEIALVAEAIRSGVLTCTKGEFTKSFENKFAASVGAKHASACSSGSAAIHTAISAIDPEPGDEIITTSITDMGALTPILYQTAIPVFADVDPHTFNVTAESIERCISAKTKAIIVTHLFGNPCGMTDIMALADSKGIPVIEDCAQAFEARHAGKPVGTFGAVGCFSLQQGKHITTGEGGVVVTNDDAYARRMYHFINKAWPYGEPNPDHYFIAINYRMNELTGAVASAQMDKLSEGVQQRIDMANRLTSQIAGIEGLETPVIREGDECTYWKYCVSVDPAVIPGGPNGLAQALKGWEIPSAPRYIQKPAFECKIFRDQVTFGTSRFPFNLARPEAVDYSRELFPGTYQALERVLVLPWNEKYTEEHVDYVAASIREAIATLVS